MKNQNHDNAMQGMSGAIPTTPDKDAISKIAPPGKDGHPLAPNGERSYLTEDQWAAVCPGDFKQWFSDQPVMASLEVLQCYPVAILTGDEFKPDGVPLTEKVPQWYAQNGFSIVDVAGIGKVCLDEKAVRNSLSHGIARNKAAAFAAVPYVLQKGRIIHSEELRGQRDGGMAFHVAAPIRMGEQEMVVDILVKAGPKMNRMWVHEVVTTEKLRQAAFKTSADAAEAGVQTGAVAGAVRKVLHSVFSVNPETVSKIVNMSRKPS